MNHPTTPCRDSMKPIFAWVLSKTKAKFADRPTKSYYICQTLAAFCSEHKLTNVQDRAVDTVFKFVEDSLGDRCTFGSWMSEKNAEVKALHDSGNWREYNKKTNEARIAWLEWLTNPPT